MAIQDLLRTLGQRASTGLERMGATTDPRLSPAAQRLAGIQNLSQALRRTGATLSGDPQRIGILGTGVSGMPTQSTQTSQKKTGVGDVLGTSAQLAAMYMMMSSDERLKDNIELIGNEKGYNIYSWTWNKVAKKLGINSPTTGVLAQEVMKINPDAVSVNDNGYYMVNYGAL